MDNSSINDVETPWIINLELTNACNLECVFCDHALLKKKMAIKDMDDSLLLKVLTEIEAHRKNDKIYELGLVGLGEPTLDKNLERHIEIIDSFAHMFERLSFNSNLVSLKQKQIEILLNSKISAYTFSVNASNKETYRKMTGKDRFEQVIENLAYFLSQRKQKEIGSRVDIQLFESNENDLKELRVLFPSGSLEGINLFSRKVYSKPVIQQDCELLRLNVPNSSERYPCWDIYTRMYIDVEGNIYPCTIGNDSYRSGSGLCLGNIQQDSLFNLFNAASIREARYRSEKGEYPYPECEKCNIWSLTPNNFEWDNENLIWRKKADQIRAYGLKG